jgi:hypothetical protein
VGPAGRAADPTTEREEDLMKLRLHGTPAECATAAALLPRTPGLHIQDESRPYPDRSGELVRVYLTVRFDLAPGSQPGARADGGGARERST